MPEPPVTLEISSLQHINGEGIDYAVGVDSRAAERMVKDLALPEGAVIALVARGNQIIPPQGNTCIQAGDHVILVVRPGIQPLVNQVFGRNSDVRGSIPTTLEFPLKATATVAELQEFYSIQIDASPESTLADVISLKLEKEHPALGASVQLGPIALRILRVTTNGRIEMVGMSILPVGEVIPAELKDIPN